MVGLGGGEERETRYETYEAHSFLAVKQKSWFLDLQANIIRLAILITQIQIVVSMETT